MRFHTVNEWLRWQEQLHPTVIELGLQRLQQPLQYLGLDFSKHIVFTIAGTNGKGSCATMLASILIRAGYRVGVYTSPHLFHYSERIQINNQPISDAELCLAFSAVDLARNAESLTYFEFGTLAALHYFYQQQCEVLVLEVGLGGRLDAVNIIDSDTAIITNIGIDHTDWLGNSREEIATEKAGILRTAQRLVCADASPPETLLRKIQELQVNTSFIGKHFRISRQASTWTLHSENGDLSELPTPSLLGEFQLINAATAITAIIGSRDKLQVSDQHIREGLILLHLPGRYQPVAKHAAQLVDVAHNAPAAAVLANELSLGMQNGEKCHAVFAIQAHKDVDAVVAEMAALVSHWHLAPLAQADSLPTSEIEIIIKKYNDLSNTQASIQVYKTISDAWLGAQNLLDRKEIVLIGFGSFFTVAEILLLN